MFTGIDIDAVRQYVSPNDPDKTNPTVFHIASLDTKLQGSIEDKCTTMRASAGKKDEAADMNFAMKRRSYDLVRFGVKQIENFIDPKTKEPVLFKLENVSVGSKAYLALPERVVDMLGIKLIDELAVEVEKNQNLGAEEAKN